MGCQKDPWTENVQADALAGIDATLPIKEVVLVPIIDSNFPSMQHQQNKWQLDEQNWGMGELPEDNKQAHKIRIQARFTLIRNILYRRSFGGPYLRCLNDTEAQYILA